MLNENLIIYWVSEVSWSLQVFFFFFRNLCKNPHNVFSGNNLEVLKSHNLQDLTDRQLFKLLLQNDPYLLPEVSGLAEICVCRDSSVTRLSLCLLTQVCSHYNKGNGLHGSCRNNASCPKLHICQHFLLEDCAYGSSCKRAHHFNFNDKKPFQCFSQENVENLFQIYRNRFILTAPEERRGSEFPGINTAFFCFFLKVSLKARGTFTHLRSCLLQWHKQWEAPLSALWAANLSSPPVLNPWVMLTGMKSACTLSGTLAATKVTPRLIIYLYWNVP